MSINIRTKSKWPHHLAAYNVINQRRANGDVVEELKVPSDKLIPREFQVNGLEIGQNGSFKWSMVRSATLYLNLITNLF